MPTLKNSVTSHDHIQGDFNAPITLIEYGDYQCPFCGKAYFVIKNLQKHYGKCLRFVFRNFPLTEMHPFAEPAAEAAEFASDHELFWKMHDLLYENQEALSISLLLELAEKLGLSTDNLKSILENQSYEQKIHRDFLGGVRSGVNGTPTFFINDQRYNGAYEFENLVESIDLVSAT
jgi:protein-disulfide isomerase